MQVYLRLTKKIQHASHILVFALLGLEIFFLFRNGNTLLNLQSYYIFPGIYWYYIFPPFSLFLLGRKMGSYYNIALIGFTVFFFYTDIFNNHLYDSEFKIRLLSVYSAIFFFSFLFETIRAITFKAFERTYSKKVKYLKIISAKNSAMKHTNNELAHISEEFKTQNDYLKELNHELIEQNERIAEQNIQLVQQSKEMECQQELLIKQKQSIDESILYASYIQSALLPSEDILNDYFPDHFILYKPRDTLSGDFYFYRRLGDSIIIAAADCTGHGIPGALLSMLGIASISEIIHRIGINSVGTILNEMSREVRSIIKRKSNYDAKDGIDIAICRINLLTNDMEYAGAYNPVYVIHNGELIQLKGDKQSVGRSLNNKEPIFTNQYLRLQKGDSLYMFSDGYYDQLSSNNHKKFLVHNFQELLLRIVNEKMQTQKEILEKTFEEWRNGNEQTDDVMILGMRI